jgi:hypothetical protein
MAEHLVVDLKRTVAHSRRSRSTSTSAPARKVSTTPAKPAMKISDCCGSASKALPMSAGGALLRELHRAPSGANGAYQRPPFDLSRGEPPVLGAPLPLQALERPVDGDGVQRQPPSRRRLMPTAPLGPHLGRKLLPALAHGLRRRLNQARGLRRSR